jgi:hypothetical protein
MWSGELIFYVIWKVVRGWLVFVLMNLNIELWKVWTYQCWIPFYQLHIDIGIDIDIDSLKFSYQLDMDIGFS